MDSNLDKSFDNCRYDMSKVFAWVNSDLDGIGSTILLGNLFKNFEYRHCFFGKFEEQYLLWAKENAEDYEKIFIVGMVLDQNLIKKIDDHRVVFVSDRPEDFKVWDSTMIQEECTSTTKLLYKKFKEKVEFTKNLKKFFLYVDDYNSYDLKHEETKYLNALYRKSGGNRFINFVNRFWNGFDGFTATEVKLAEGFFNELEKELEEIVLYTGEWGVFKVFSTISKFSVNELSHSIMENYKGDVVIVMNPDTKFVSFRKYKGSEVDIAKMATDLCEGGGGEWAAGGKITKEFLEFSELLVEL
jgi:oligoribonuclease NrnB/cAMP/cGMP phosphodiesterase (DHH superfamily)